MAGLKRKPAFRTGDAVIADVDSSYTVVLRHALSTGEDWWDDIGAVELIPGSWTDKTVTGWLSDPQDDVSLLIEKGQVLVWHH